MSLAVRRRTGALHHQPLLALSAVAGGVSLATLGAVLSVGMLATRNSSTPGAPAYAVGRDAPTSFGSIAVQDIALVDGLSAAELGGMTHGIQRLVPQDQVEVQVSLLLSNATARSVDYAFARQFRLVSAAGFEATLLAGSADPDGSLPGHSSLATVLRFMAPRAVDDDLFLEFRDPGQARVVRIPVGTSVSPNNRAPPGGVETIQDHTH